jgi:hypothetical protein
VLRATKALDRPNGCRASPRCAARKLPIRPRGIATQLEDLLHVLTAKPEVARREPNGRQLAQTNISSHSRSAHTKHLGYFGGGKQLGRHRSVERTSHQINKVGYLLDLHQISRFARLGTTRRSMPERRVGGNRAGGRHEGAVRRPPSGAAISEKTIPTSVC